MVRRVGCLLLTALLLCAAGEAWGWGSIGHKIINQNAVQHLPPAMSQLAAQQTFLTAHASDADNRKSSDPTEGSKHFIDLETFTDFQHLPADFSVVVAQYGLPALQVNGILPWTIVTTVDSLTAQFRRADLSKAYQTAADLGHYVGDAYQPLHCTVNYDGQLTQNSGIHSRYETSMLGQYQSSITITPDTIHLVSDVFAFANEIVVHSNSYVDSILQGDNAAKAASGWNGSGTAPALYYSTLWQKIGRLTQEVLQHATRDVASLWYTSWVRAGVTDVQNSPDVPPLPKAYVLEQNFPNPFNPTTRIRYTVSGKGSGDAGGHGSGGIVNSQSTIVNQSAASGSAWVRLSVYDILGREVAVLVNGEKQPGSYEVSFDGSALTSGMYISRLSVGTFAQPRTMTLVR